MENILTIMYALRAYVITGSHKVTNELMTVRNDKITFQRLQQVTM